MELVKDMTQITLLLDCNVQQSVGAPNRVYGERWQKSLFIRLRSMLRRILRSEWETVSG